MATLTTNQRRVLDFVRSFLEEQGYPPTHAEIAEGLGFRSPNAAAAHLRLMAKKGVVAIVPGRSRGLRLLEEAAGTARGRGEAEGSEGVFPVHEASASLPLIGHVAAGQPVLAEQNVERRVAIDPAFFRPRPDYLLRVRGDSMIEAGILDGDLVAVHRAARVRDAEIAVVRLDDEVTVKRWGTAGHGDERRVVLAPANAALEPIVVDPRRTAVVVEGLVVGLVRAGMPGGSPR